MRESWGLSIRHHTGFLYDGLARASYNEARMAPQTLSNQQVQSSKISVHPVCAMSSHIDYFGTLVTSFDVQEPHQQLEVEATSLVQSWAATLPTPLSWDELLQPILADQFSEYLLPTGRTIMTADAREEVGHWRRLADVHQCVEAVADFVRNEVAYVARATSVSATAQEVWDRKKGVCQDIAHVTLGLLRAMGIPARYVSGYFYPETSSQVGDVVEGQSHAWVEYFSGSWTGIDPTNGVRESERHVVVGCGRDYDDVAPLKGIYQGPQATQLGVVVEIRRTQ